MPRIDFISQEEIRLFEQPPVFNIQEKEYFFTLSKSLHKFIMENIRSDANILHFVILYGYFRASNVFYNHSSFHQDDLDFIRKKYKLKIIELSLLNRKTLYRYKQITKDNLAVNNYTVELERTLLNEAINLANNFTNRKKIFYRLMNLSKKLKIEIPSYTELTRIISIAINIQKKDIIDKLTLLMDDENLTVLDEFLDKDTKSKSRYNISHYRKMEHSTNKNQMILSLGKLNLFKSKFSILKSIIKTIGITPKIAEYYSKWTEKSKISQLTQTNNINQKFTLLSFTYHQYLIRNDNLIERFISTVQSAKNSLYRAQKEFSYTIQPQKDKLLQSLEINNLSILSDIKLIVKDEELSALNKVEEIKRIINLKTSDLEEILLDKKVLDSNNKNKYEFIEKKSISLQGKLSGILKVIEFDEESSDKNIITAINHFRTASSISSKSPSGFLDEDEKNAVFDKDKFRISLYKTLLFFHVSDSIKKGTLHLKYSVKYRNIEEYLISEDVWKKDKNKLIERHGLENLKPATVFIESIETQLSNNFNRTNKNIQNSKNSYFTPTDNSFILKTPKLDKTDNQEESITKYFPNNEYISIVDVLDSINSETDFLSSFQHHSQSKSRVKYNALLAAILGYGCNLNLNKMGKISKGISESQLDNIKSWYFSEENTQEANDKIISFTDSLEIVKTVRNNQGINHTSSDGQKYNISKFIDSTNAGYSFKYFGTDKGVVDYKFIDESHRLFHSKVINVNERESGYVIDGLLHNDVVKSDIHSTDTHGFTEIIFGLTHLLGFSFAPRIKNVKNQQLYAFNTPKFYQDLQFKLIPKRKIKVQLITDNWDDILRFIITMKEKKASATQLLKRLTSYSKQHKLYTALKELGKIIKTDFLLSYIDDMQLRQRIEKQLNKVEASNRFSKAVFFGNNSEFTVSTAEEQNIANNSKRLIQNVIILWNYMFINKKVQQANNLTERNEILKAMKNSSIVHWSHINFYGEYDFTRSSKRIHRLIALGEIKTLS